MQELILAGGKGDAASTADGLYAKADCSVLNRPFLLYQIEILAARDQDITLSLSYQRIKSKTCLRRIRLRRKFALRNRAVRLGRARV